jgi:hypothetical protein
MPKEPKKDQAAPREVTRDIEQETFPRRSETTYRKHNRDKARGDWDRTGRHGDEGTSRDEEPKEPRPEDLYPDRGGEEGE